MRNLSKFLQLILLLSTSAVVIKRSSRHQSGRGVYSEAAVAADIPECSSVGRKILEDGGSAVDAGIATVICIGVFHPQYSGIGGGHISLMYNATTRNVTRIVAKELSPFASDLNFFVNKDPYLAVYGGLSVGIPGQIAGFWEAHQRGGRLPWRDLFQPSIDLCKKGVRVTSSLQHAMNLFETELQTLWIAVRRLLMNKDNTMKKEGDILYRPLLAKTLTKIATEGASTFYNGSLAKDLLKDLQDTDEGTIITQEDLSSYQPVVTQAEKVDIGPFATYTTTTPGDGSLATLIINIIDGYNLTSSDLKGSRAILTYHRFIEAFKFAFALRSNLGESNPHQSELIANLTSHRYADDVRAMIDDDVTHPVASYGAEYEGKNSHGTTHVDVLDFHGNAFVITSSLNHYFGSKMVGKRTGIIFNDIMDDFSIPNVENGYKLPASPFNFIFPGHHAQSSMSPMIILQDKGKPQERIRMLIGASGGPKILTGVAQVVLNSLWFGKSPEEAVSMPRVHCQLHPPVAEFETGFDQKIVKALEAKGHVMEENTDITAPVIQMIEVKEDGKLEAVCDWRRGGHPDGF